MEVFPNDIEHQKNPPELPFSSGDSENESYMSNGGDDDSHLKMFIRLTPNPILYFHQEHEIEG